jgi:hypothetical protein
VGTERYRWGQRDIGAGQGDTGAGHRDTGGGGIYRI